MTDPWEAFVARSDGAEIAGYFERRPDRREGPGAAVAFVGADFVETLTPRTDLEELTRATGRFLRSGRRGRAVLGYAGFDAVGLFEPALRDFPEGSPFPLGEFAFVERAEARALPPRRRSPGRATAPPATALRPAADSLPRARFVESVRRLRRDIRDGEAYQIVLAHRRRWSRPDDLLGRAGRLRASERYAYFYYLRFRDREIVGASPESVVEVHGTRALVNPIAGTIWRGPGSPHRLPLEVDPKELAEHRMLVDLARNDLGAIARPGSVHLPWTERRVRYARVDHLVSRVAATLRAGVGPWQALGATFPAGTVSGAPKIRATELLRREERTWRGPYAGAVGLLLPGGRADFALAIRTAFAEGRHLYTAAGGGVVYRSRPAQEFRETLAKLAQVEATFVEDR